MFVFVNCRYEVRSLLCYVYLLHCLQINSLLNVHPDIFLFTYVLYNEVDNFEMRLSITHRLHQPLCCWWLIWSIQNDAKNLKNDWNPDKWVLIWEYSIDTKVTGFKCFSKIIASLSLKVASALEGFTENNIILHRVYV